MTSDNNLNSIDISSSEIHNIQQYLAKKNTAVVTIMFTDIKDFTLITEQKGEEYSSNLRSRHDKILKDTIEKDNVGLVVKFIGDAVMAIFSEPSSAVERALLIQKNIKAFNESADEFENIAVRIGLHMGQVTIEDKIQADVFGRHVNRASRIESLADGNQIFLSYSVFDSAKGWLTDKVGLEWTLHGSYFLKGIQNPIEIYEVTDLDLGKPLPPKSGNKKRTFPKFLASAILVFIGVLLAAGFFLYDTTQVAFVGFYPDKLYIDGNTRVILDGQKSDDSREALIDISSGKHVLHYTISASLRYYAEVDIKRGQNFLEPIYKSMRLPSLELRDGLSLNSENEANKEASYNYYYYDDSFNKVNYESKIKLNLLSQLTEKDDVSHTINLELTVNGNVINKEFKVINFIDNKEAPRAEILIFEDDFHEYELRYYTSKSIIDIAIRSYFKEYRL